MVWKSSIVAALLLFWLGPAPVAEPDKPAYAAFAERCKSLPEPSKDLGFRFEGDITFLGYPIGLVSLSATSERVNGKLGWKCTEMWQRGLDRKRAWIMRSTMLMTREFILVSGESRWMRDGYPWKLKWKGGAGSLRVTAEAPRPEETPEPATVEHDGPLLAGHAPQVLFLRLAKPVTTAFPAPRLDIGRPA